MDITHYQRLLEEFCALSGLDSSARLLEGAPIELDGVSFVLLYNQELAPKYAFVYCDFGEIPPGREQEAHYALLRANIFYLHSQGLSLGISPETGRVLSGSHYHLADLTAESLLSHLRYLALQANNWRQTLFIDSNAQSAEAQQPAAAQPAATANSAPAPASSVPRPSNSNAFSELSALQTLHMRI